MSKREGKDSKVYFIKFPVVRIHSVKYYYVSRAKKKHISSKEQLYKHTKVIQINKNQRESKSSFGKHLPMICELLFYLIVYILNDILQVIK